MKPNCQDCEDGCNVIFLAGVVDLLWEIHGNTEKAEERDRIVNLAYDIDDIIHYQRHGYCIRPTVRQPTPAKIIPFKSLQSK